MTVRFAVELAALLVASFFGPLLLGQLMQGDGTPWLAITVLTTTMALVGGIILGKRHTRLWFRRGR